MSWILCGILGSTPSSISRTWYHAPDDIQPLFHSWSSPAVYSQHVLIPPPRHRGDTNQKRLRTFYRMRSSQKLMEISSDIWSVGEGTPGLIALGCESRRLHNSTWSCLRLIIIIIHWRWMLQSWEELMGSRLDSCLQEAHWLRFRDLILS